MDTQLQTIADKLRHLFEVQGMDAYVNTKRVRIIYNDRNVAKKMLVRNSDHVFVLGDVVKINTAKYIVTGTRPSQVSPYINEAMVRLEF